MPNPRLSPILLLGVLVLALLMLCGGPLSGFFLTRNLLYARASATWPHVTGTLTRARIHEISTVPGRNRYAPDVNYQYAIGPRNYTGTKVWMGDGETNDRRSQESTIAGLTPGIAVDVYYDPADPTISVLKPGARATDYLVMVVPVIMLTIGLGAIALIIRAFRS